MTKVLIADDHPVVREGVRRILQGAVEMEVPLTELRVLPGR